MPAGIQSDTVQGMTETTGPRPLPLATAIDAAGMTPLEFAESIGTYASNVSKWCHEDRYLRQRPTPAMWLKIIEALMLDDDMARRLALWFEQRYRRGVK